MMNEETFINNVRQQYMDPEDVSFEMASEFRQVDSYDSLTGMTIMVMIKDEYGVDISEEQYRSKKTIQELYDFVASIK